jgi:hypothetical protein
VVLAVFPRIEVYDQLVAELSGVLNEVRGKDVNVILAPWSKRGKVARHGVEPPDVLLGLALVLATAKEQTKSASIDEQNARAGEKPEQVWGFIATKPRLIYK